MRIERLARWSLGVGIGLSLAASAQAMEFRLRLTGQWTSALLDDPATLPATAHFTALVGATHSGAPLWASGALASTGIENVAEVGSTSALFQEVSARIAAGTAGAWIQAPALTDVTGFVETTFEASATHSRVSLISMVAPSPDWFVGIPGVSLIGANGQWIDRLSFDLRPWDAGTEQGIGFSLANPDTIPRQAIHELFDSPFLGRPVIAQLSIERVGAVPEPATGALLGLALLALGAARRRGRDAR